MMWQRCYKKLPVKVFIMFCMAGSCVQANGAFINTDTLPKTQKLAWQIDMKSVVHVLPGATKMEQKRAQTHNANKDSLFSRLLLNKDYFLRTFYEGPDLQLLIDARDSMIYTKIAGRLDSINWAVNKARERKNKVNQLLNFRLFPDSIQELSGLRCSKVTYQTKADSSQIVAWYTQELPWRNFQLHHKQQVPGIILKSSVKIGHLLYQKEVSRIQKVPVSDTDFVLKPDTFIATRGKISKLPTKDSIQDLLVTYRDSMINSLKKIKQKHTYTLGTVSKFGFIQIKNNDSTYYVDQIGQYAFDTITYKYHPVTLIHHLQPGWENIEHDDSITMLIVGRNGKFGLIRADSGWVLPPHFDAMQINFNRYLAIYKNAKMGYADTRGHILVPPKFDKVNIMDDNYFDVKIKNKWSIYSRALDKLILPVVYDEFDYCGGCGGGSDYVYASKNGKWGVIGFDGKVRLPFAYEHPAHYAMRSDNWVTSFEKDGHKVVINLANQKVYSDTQYQDMKVINGVLCLKKNGKYGMIDSNAKTSLPFIYDKIGDPYSRFDWGPYIQIYKNGKCGIIDNKGHILISPEKYKDIYASNDRFGAYINDTDVIVLDQKGQPLTPAGQSISDWRHPLEVIDSAGQVNLLYIIHKNRKEGFYNVATGDLLPAIYNSVDVLKTTDTLNRYIVVQTKDKQKTLYSIYGTRLLPGLYDNIKLLDGGLVRTRKDWKYGLFNINNGTEIATTKYNNIDQVNSRFYLLQISDSCCKETRIYDVANKKDIQLRGYNKIQLAGAGLLRVDDSVNTYLYSLEQSSVISKGYPIRHFELGNYEGIQTNTFGLFKVYQGKYGFINKYGRIVIPLSYDRIGISKAGVIQLRQNQKNNYFTYQYADSTGTFLSDSIYSFKERIGNEYPYYFQNKQYLVISHYDSSRNENLIGLMNLAGKVIVSPQYTKVLPSTNLNAFIVQRFNRWGLLDKDGKTILPTFLDNIYTAPSYPLTERDIQFPVLCKLDGMYFYVGKAGNILPFTTKNIESYGHLW